MGNLLTALTSEEKTTPRKREYATSFSHHQYSTGPTTSAANPRIVKKESPQWERSESSLNYKASQTTTQHSSRVLSDQWLENYLAARAKIIKQQEKEREYASSSSYRHAGPTSIAKKKELPKASQATTQRSSRVLIEPITFASQTKAQISKQGNASKVKENATSSSLRSYNTVVNLERKTTYGMKNDVSLLVEGNLTDSNREDVKKITEIVRHILQNSQFVGVYGNWSCRRWPMSCDNEEEWQILLSRESLRRYLLLTPEKKLDFFMRSCKECGKENLISSFFLCKRLPTFAEDTVEIICHLEWNNHYRVFADWKCQRPQHDQRHIWKSSYTWISLQKFIEKASAKDFGQKDFKKQKCYECREKCSKCKDKPKKYRGCNKCDYEGVITRYDCLVPSGGGKPHKRWLCAKCQEGAICVRTDNNHRVRRNRNIMLS